jgi:hypothetical protein
MEVLREEFWLVLGTGLAWFVPIGFGVRALARDPGGRAFLAAGLLVPIALVLLVSLRVMLVDERYLIFLAPLLLYLAVLGAWTAPGLLRPALFAGLVVLHAAGLLAYHFGDTPVGERLTSGHPYGKEQWRDAHDLVTRQAGRGDVVLLHARFNRAVWNYYAEDGGTPAVQVPPDGLPQDALLTPDELLAQVPALAGARQVFLVLSHETTADRDAYRNVVAKALLQAWPELRIDAPVLLPRQGGIRIVRFVRS